MEYELFHPITKEKLNLDYCSDTKINLLIPTSIDEENLDKYNTSSDYYNNKCSPSTTQNSIDITLKDRAIEYINNNLSLCERNCEYSGYDTKYKKVKCNCQAKSKFEYIFKDYNFDRDKLMNNFKNIKETFNLVVFHCYYVLFTKDGFTKNIGNFFILSILIIYFFLRSIFFVKGYDSFKIKIIKILKLSSLSQNMNNINKDKSINNTNNNDINNNENNDPKILEKNIKPKRKSKFKINNKRKVNMTEIAENKDNKNIIISNDEIGIRSDKGINIYCKKDDNNACTDKNFKNSCKTLKEKANNNIRINLSNNAPPKKVKVKKKKSVAFRNQLALNILESKSSNNISVYSKRNINAASSINEINKNNISIDKNSDTLRINNNKSLDNSKYTSLNDYELNNLQFSLALKIDKRTYIQYYLSLLKMKHLLIFTFCNFNDYNSIIIKICLFFFSFALYLTVNALFFTDSTMHDIYENGGKYNFIYRLAQIIYSIIITTIINLIIKYLSLSENDISNLKNLEKKENFNERIEKVFKCLIIRFTLFFDISILFLLLFWYYLSCFCAVYRNTQIFLIKDTLVSFLFSLLYQFIISLIPGIFRIQALNNKINNKECMYKVSKLLQLL